ncbi:threonine synthase [Buchnera aphidicola]|uniref:Threonine synthase n=1 Tax=Buchnera aphidicola (Stegophylla sp.) TaxID=2315800 RepID=A0A4D6YKF9_9GAMM|nr:threonine synthase [Buchnera aphidicola (Stegophylla sp.)]QCI26320.1 threonine synthase [Buchnera aphidicola (Stegophylla sp.)]
MKLYNLKNHNEQVNFLQAVNMGLGHKQGLFFPKHLPTIHPYELEKLLNMDFFTRSIKILSMFLKDEIKSTDLKQYVQNAFSFPGPRIVPVLKNISCCELFHGPTLAFKDFGARFMAQILSHINNSIMKNNKTTILTATSGDTGAAVAHAFYKIKNVNVIILYPHGKISKLQENLFCTLGHNITTISINGSFDKCQQLVKQAFNDQELRVKIGLNSANSINISRLLAQICYYFEAYALISQENRKQLVISIPCGNFGNLTAGLLAKSMGLPIKSFIAATNVNDTVPRFLSTGKWEPHHCISTISNAMDISRPNNWPRVQELFHRKQWKIKKLNFGSVSDSITKKTLSELKNHGYISEPHAAIAYRLLKHKLQHDEFGLFLGTAHPAKFKHIVDKILNENIQLPEELKKYSHLPLLSYYMKPNFNKLKKFLLLKQ